MHRAAPLCAVAFAVACGGPSGPASGTEKRLHTAIAAYDSAWQQKDTPAIERILSPGYTYFSSTGELSDKSRTLRFLADTGYVLTLSRRSEVQVKLAGRTAVISSRWEGEGRYRAEAVHDDQTCGQTWIWTGDEWLLLSEHCVNRPGARPPPAATGLGPS